MAVERMPLDGSLEIAVDNAWPTRLWKDTHVVLAVSGGADSVGMLRAMLRLKGEAGGSGNLYVGHLNHGLRKRAADDDAAWLKQLCQARHVPLEIGKAEVAEHSNGDGWEAAARRARYDFLRELAERVGARYIAIAHTADDQAETVLHRIVRGTGLAGLAGIPFARPLSHAVSIVRPLLQVQRATVLSYLTLLGQAYRFDESNVDARYTRNRLRHDLLPKLRADYNGDVDTALRRLAEHASEAQRLIAGSAASLLESAVSIEVAAQAVTPIAHWVSIDCTTLAEVQPLLIREMLKLAWTRAGWRQQAMGRVEWEKLAELVTRRDEIGALNLPDNVRAERKRNIVTLKMN